MNKAMGIDPQDMSALSSSSKKYPVTILNEYALKNQLVPHYILIHDGSSLSIVSFKYKVNLGTFSAVGKGLSKKEAKHSAASNLIKIITNDNPQLLNTDFNECAIPPYNSNNKVNNCFTKITKAIEEIDLQDMSALSSPSNKNPVTILNEYAVKNHLVPHYNLIYDHSPLGIVSFKCSVHLDKFIAFGEGFSKREAKHSAASNLMKKITNDNPQLLNTDFNECAIPPYNSNNKVNNCFTKINKAIKEIDSQDTSALSSSSNKHPVTILNEYAAKNNLVIHYELIHSNGSSLGIVNFKYRVNLDTFVAFGEGFSKKEAKHLAASNLLEKIINNKPQLLNTDFNECTISTYDNNNKVNNCFTKINKVIKEIDSQDTSALSSSSKKYAVENHLVPDDNLIHDGSSLSTVSFKNGLTQDTFIALGEGSSKKNDKHLAASNLLKKFSNDVPLLLNTDFNECAVGATENIKENYIGRLDEMCRHKNIEIAQYYLVKEEGKTPNELFTISCHVANMIETATHGTKKQAKSLAAFQMINSLGSSDIVIEEFQNVVGSMKALERVNTLKSMGIRKSSPKHPNCDDFHLVFKKTVWKTSDTLNMVVNQYIKKGELDLTEPYNILQKIVTEHEMHLNSSIQKINNSDHHQYACTFALTHVYPHIYGMSIEKNSEMAQHIAAKELLIGICILLK